MIVYVGEISNTVVVSAVEGKSGGIGLGRIAMFVNFVNFVTSEGWRDNVAMTANFAEFVNFGTSEGWGITWVGLQISRIS